MPRVYRRVEIVLLRVPVAVCSERRIPKCTGKYIPTPASMDMCLHCYRDIHPDWNKQSKKKKRRQLMTEEERKIMLALRREKIKLWWANRQVV